MGCLLCLQFAWCSAAPARFVRRSAALRPLLRRWALGWGRVLLAAGALPAGPALAPVLAFLAGGPVPAPLPGPAPVLPAGAPGLAAAAVAAAGSPPARGPRQPRFADQI